MNRILRQVVEGLALCPAAVCHQIQKRPVHAAIFGKFRVKRRRHRFPLTDGDRIIAFGRDYFDSGPMRSILGARIKTISIGDSPSLP